MSEDTTATCDAPRRAVLLSAGGAGLMTALAACAGQTGHTDHSGHTSLETGTATDTASAPAADAPASARPGIVLAKTSDIPLEGGTVFPDRKVVVVQPAKGKFRAFSEVCTHQGCAIDDVSSGMINCPCHGSMFWLDGTVMGGPATKPPPEVEIKVDDDTISRA